MGNCLVISCIKAVGKETARCIRFELTPRRFVFFVFSWMWKNAIMFSVVLSFCLDGIMLRFLIFILAGQRVKSSVLWTAKWLNPSTCHGIRIFCFFVNYHQLLLLSSLCWLMSFWIEEGSFLGLFQQQNILINVALGAVLMEKNPSVDR